MGICHSCCWYDNDQDKCLHPKDEPDPDINGKCGIVLGCARFVEIEDDGCFTNWFVD